MEQIELEATKREVTGKQVRFLRRKGVTPANMYGHGLDSVALQLDTKKLKQTLAKAGKTDLISLAVADSDAPVKVLIREVQKNPVTQDLLHVDFYQVKMTEKIKAEIPLVFVGEAPATKKKNMSLLHLVDTVHIEALPDHLPHNFEIDISHLEDPDQAIHVKDISISSDIILLSDPEQMIIKVAEARGVVEEAPAAEAEAEEITEEAAEEATEEKAE